MEEDASRMRLVRMAQSQAPLESRGCMGLLRELRGTVWTEARTESIILQLVKKADFIFVDGMYEPAVSTFFLALPPLSLWTSSHPF